MWSNTLKNQLKHRAPLERWSLNRVVYKHSAPTEPLADTAFPFGHAICGSFHSAGVFYSRFRFTIHDSRLTIHDSRFTSSSATCSYLKTPTPLR